MKVDPDTVKRFHAARRLEALNATQDALAMRDYLLDCLDNNLVPDAPATMLASAKKAEPQGEFPSHEILLMAYAHEL